MESWEISEKNEGEGIIYFWPNTSSGPLSFMFVSDRSFKFLAFR